MNIQERAVQQSIRCGFNTIKQLDDDARTIADFRFIAGLRGYPMAWAEDALRVRSERLVAAV